MYQIITDMEGADELWKQGLLWLACTADGTVPKSGSWVPIHDYRPGNEGRMAPSVWRVDSGLTAYYAVLLEE